MNQFTEGVGEGLWAGAKGLATGVVSGVEAVAKEGRALATDANARGQTLDTVEHGGSGGW